MVSAIHARPLLQHFEPAMRHYQYGAGCSNGPTAMLAHLEAAQQDYTTPCFLQLDVSNAFGSLDRQVVQLVVDCMLPALHAGCAFQPDGVTNLPVLPDYLRLWLTNHLHAPLTVPCPHDAQHASATVLACWCAARGPGQQRHFRYCHGMHFETPLQYPG
eukprot:1118752-Amphidinium_carterae.1